MLAVGDDTDVILITRDGKILRTDADRIRKTGGSASGVKLMTIEAEDVVAAACTVVEAESESGQQGGLLFQKPAGTSSYSSTRSASKLWSSSCASSLARQRTTTW